MNRSYRDQLPKVAPCAAQYCLSLSVNLHLQLSETGPLCDFLTKYRRTSDVYALSEFSECTTITNILGINEFFCMIPYETVMRMHCGGCGLSEMTTHGLLALSNLILVEFPLAIKMGA